MENKEHNNLNKVIKKLTKRNNAPAYLYYLLALFYIISSVFTSATASLFTTIKLFGIDFPVYSFAGIFSSISQITIILITFYYGKKGYYTALTLQLIQMFSIILGLIKRHNFTSVPGIFGCLLTILAITLIYINNRRVDKYQEVLQRQAVTDSLTELPNRYACSELLDILIERKEKYIATSIDLNGFKNINDTMGFDSGNIVLKSIANRWMNIANRDNAETLDFIARISGDEFALIIRNYDSEEQVIDTIKKYEKALADHITVDDCDLFVTASFGYAEYPNDSDSKDAVLTCADAAMREVKRRKSSNHILHFKPNMLKDEHTLEIETKIREALEKQSIFFHLQPQYNMNHELRGFESLARMQDENGKFISPGEFIPVAEKVGLVDKVDKMVFRKSAMFFGDLLKKTNADITLSVNVSVRHLLKNDFLDEIKNVLKESGVPASKLEIEITESIMIDSVDKALKRIDNLKDMGIKIAIDDFGTGYSSLSYLNKFPANLLKIDKSFIDTMNTNKSSKQYVSAIISMGHIMGFDVISEGVEDNSQVDTLKEIGCDYIQGFIWGRPLPQDEVEKLVLKAV